MILLDTNALLWLDRSHPRARPLTRLSGRLYASPASLLEIQLLTEVGRVRLRRGTTPATLSRDTRWLVDSPPSTGWFEEALALTWTRDPFDRLLVAHARTRGWRLATADGALLDRLGPAASLELRRVARRALSSRAATGARMRRAHAARRSAIAQRPSASIPSGRFSRL